ncbi:MAG: hypothetical protein WAV41_00455 [Microgenomates group bacterium]
MKIETMVVKKEVKIEDNAEAIELLDKGVIILAPVGVVRSRKRKNVGILKVS